MTIQEPSASKWLRILMEQIQPVFFENLSIDYPKNRYNVYFVVSVAFCYSNAGTKPEIETLENFLYVTICRVRF